MGKKNAPIRDTVRLGEKTVQAAQEMTGKWSPTTRVTRTVTQTDTIEGYKIPREVMEVALGLAGGDITRLKVNKDGSVLVVNQSRKVEIKR